MGSRDLYFESYQLDFESLAHWYTFSNSDPCWRSSGQLEKWLPCRADVLLYAFPGGSSKSRLEYVCKVAGGWPRNTAFLQRADWSSSSHPASWAPTEDSLEEEEGKPLCWCTCHLLLCSGEVTRVGQSSFWTRWCTKYNTRCGFVFTVFSLVTLVCVLVN